ncbi:DUF2207 domain-containing protein [Actinomadura rugatobispora]|uniref:DUF2207 domain-containing protein n=1 Tax=Actinomadura rugatobispora TaxID=1994 RepID=A0ABW0ZLH6_9ACTN|nr:hypothetical protein GCM10010200_059410 [Actinomadura rugatobispora]
MPDVRGRIRGLAVAVGLWSLVTAGPALPAAGSAPAEAPPGPAAARPEPGPVESIPAYDVVLTIDRQGVLHVRETITYDFDRGGEHGIERPVPYRRGDRLYEVRNIRTSSSTGAPARARTLRLLNDVRITVGGQGHRVTGRQAYVIEYEMAGLFTPRAGRAELAWDAIGRSWDVPIDEVAVRVQAPVPLRKVSCHAGTLAAGTRCLRDRDGPYAIGFTQRGLRPREGVLVRVRLPKGAVNAPPPQYAPPRWDGTWAGTAVLGVALAAGMLVAARAAGGRPLPRPLPRRRSGRLLAAGGALAVLADVADDVVPRGPWAFSLGDLSVAGLGVILVGAGIAGAHRARRPEPAPTAPREDYS